MSPPVDTPAYFVADGGVVLRVDPDGLVRAATAEQVAARRELRRADNLRSMRALADPAYRAAVKARPVAQEDLSPKRRCALEDVLRGVRTLSANHSAGGRNGGGPDDRIGGRPFGIVGDGDRTIAANGLGDDLHQQFDPRLQPDDPFLTRSVHRLISRLFKGRTQARVAGDAQ